MVAGGAALPGRVRRPVIRSIHLITPEYLPEHGGVGDYTRGVARGLAHAGDDVHVWCKGGGRGEPGDRFPVHPEFGEFSARDLKHAGEALDRFPAPRRLLVQWVPHAFGYRAMNLRFCFWLWRRAAKGDAVELMVHEPFLAWGGSWRQAAAAGVHRVMTIVLLRAAQRVWVSIPAWEPMLRPYALGRALPIEWLPIPSNLSDPDAATVAAVRAAYPPPLVGHLGTYGSLIAPLLSDALVQLLGQPAAPRVLLLGTGSQEFGRGFLAEHPEWSSAVRAAGTLSDSDLSAHIAACDAMIQPYPDGISSRRTTAMAALALGVPVITNTGALSEPVWRESGAVRLTDVGDARGMAAHTMDVLSHAEARRALQDGGRALYARLFEVRHTIEALRGAASGKAA
jgi:glycosyltransferase involved in cell wall biosynthesis